MGYFESHADSHVIRVFFNLPCHRDSNGGKSAAQYFPHPPNKVIPFVLSLRINPNRLKPLFGWIIIITHVKASSW